MALGLLAVVVILGGIGLAAVATFVAALIAQSTGGGGRGGLFFVVAFPMLTPALISCGQRGTLAAFVNDQTTVAMAHNSLVVLATFDVAAITASFLLFGWVWTET